MYWRKASKAWFKASHWPSYHTYGWHTVSTAVLNRVWSSSIFAIVQYRILTCFWSFLLLPCFLLEIFLKSRSWYPLSQCRIGYSSGTTTLPQYYCGTTVQYWTIVSNMIHTCILFNRNLVLYHQYSNQILSLYLFLKHQIIITYKYTNIIYLTNVFFVISRVLHQNQS